MTVEPVPEEVLAEQLGYLVKHAETCVEPECAECARLCSVVKALMVPFEVKQPAWKETA
jgi:NAD-dependent dihydropyrimidine dehydrogenase PreA subunit